MTLQYTIAEAASMMNATPPDRGTDRIIAGVSTDTRTLAKGDLFFALAGDNYDGDTFVEEAFAKGAAGAVVQRPHETRPCIVVPNTLEALQQMAAAHTARQNARVIAITGSCGKTTSKDMIASVLASTYPVVKSEGNLNNEIGCPLSLLRITPETRYAIIEMGANHAGEITQLCRIARPAESTVTMVGPAHLEGFGGIEGVARAKSEIMEALPPDGCFYVNMDDPYCRAMGERFTGEKVRFGREGDVILESIIQVDENEMTLHIAPVGRIRLPLKVKAHAGGVLLAVAVGLRHGIEAFEAPLREACQNAARFTVLQIGGVTILDDSYNANPASMEAAIETLKNYNGAGKKIAILGAMFELGAAAAQLHYNLGELAARSDIACLVARGPNASDMVAGAQSAGLAQAYAFDSAEAAAAMARRIISPGDVVLVKGSRGMRMEEIIAKLRETV